VLLRGLELTGFMPFALCSPSSGGSERGLDVDVKGLSGGLRSIGIADTAESGRVSLPFICMVFFADGGLVGSLDAFRASYSSNGRITRV
jgi:hypothetical protein